MKLKTVFVGISLVLLIAALAFAQQRMPMQGGMMPHQQQSPQAQTPPQGPMGGPGGMMGPGMMGQGGMSPGMMGQGMMPQMMQQMMQGMMGQGGMMGPGMGMGPGRGMMRRGMMSPQMVEMVIEALGLSEEQAQSVRSLHATFRKEAVKKEAEIQIAEIDLQEALRQSSVDLANIEMKVKQIASLEADLRLAEIKTHEQFKALLNDEQKKKLKTMEHRRMGAL